MSKRFYPQLEGIRGIAVLAVLISHWIIISYFPSFKFLQLGFIGVNVFFVLSGFLITGILLSDIENGTASKKIFKNFYMKRLVRIFPIYYLVIFLLAILKIDNNYLPWSLTYTVNIAQNWFISPNPLYMHIWSLCVEEQFYLFWPIILVFVPCKRLLSIILLTIFSSLLFKLVIALIEPNNAINLIHSNTLASMDALGLGGLLAYIHKHKPLYFIRLSNFSALWIPISLLSFWSISFITPEHSLLSDTLFRLFTALWGAMLILKGIKNEKTTVGRILNFSPIKYIGKISYGIYLYHWFISSILKSTFINFWNSLDFGPFKLLKYQQYLGSFTFYFVITLTVASLSYFMIEIPFLNLKKKLQ
nr:acyltransferase [uncultured Carboxylicivirga sp.]